MGYIATELVRAVSLWRRRELGGFVRNVWLRLGRRWKSGNCGGVFSLSGVLSDWRFGEDGLERDHDGDFSGSHFGSDVNSPLVVVVVDPKISGVGSVAGIRTEP